MISRINDIRVIRMAGHFKLVEQTANLRIEMTDHSVIVSNVTTHLIRIAGMARQLLITAT